MRAGNENPKVPENGGTVKKWIILFAFFVVAWDEHKLVPWCDDTMVIHDGDDISGRTFNPDQHCGYKTETYMRVVKLMSKQDVNIFLGVDDFWSLSKSERKFLKYDGVEVVKVDGDSKEFQ